MKSNVLEGPRSLKGDIESFAVDVERFLAGKITTSMFKAKRVPMGIYEQRQSGSFMQRVRAPGGRMTSDQAYWPFFQAAAPVSEETIVWPGQALLKMLPAAENGRQDTPHLQRREWQESGAIFRYPAVR